MGKLIYVLLSVGLFVSTTLAQTEAGNGTASGQPRERFPRRVVGKMHQEIADSSPVVSASITPIGGSQGGGSQTIYMAGSEMKIEVVLENISNHEIKYSFESRDHRYRRQGIVFLDVRDGNGNLAPETEDGCRSHFFSTCLTLRSI